MRLTPRQREVIAQRGYLDFVERLAAHLRAAFPGETSRFDDAALRAAIDDVVTKSGEHGFTTEFEIASIAEYLLALGLDLADPCAQAVLSSNKLPRALKLDKLGAIALDAWTREARGAS